LREKCQVTGDKVVNPATGRRVRAIQAIHIFGHPCDLDPLQKLATEFGLRLLEDSAESMGTKYRGRLTGTTSDVAAFSFNGNKIMTSGGGGLLVSKHPEWLARAKYLATVAKDPGEEIVFGDIGYNYRMNSLQAALGSAQRESLPMLLEGKRKISEDYRARLAKISGISCVEEAPWAESNHWVTAIRLAPELAGIRLELLRSLRAQKILAGPVWTPVHRLKPYSGLSSHCPVAENWHARTLFLPSTVGMNESDIERVVETLGRELGKLASANRRSRS
jgi:perosamine synthetase